MKDIVLPKGTIIKIHGIPCELQHEAVIHSATIDAYGSLEEFVKAMAPDIASGNDKLSEMYSG